MLEIDTVLIVIILVVLAILLLIICWLLRERAEYKRTLNATLEHLDLAISGTEQESVYDESMDAAIIERLNQLVTISKLNYEDAQGDKNLVQSLISDIAHQVRTPLTNIMLYAGILQEKTMSEDNQKMAKQIHHQSEKLDFFMNELVRSSYLETEMISIHRLVSDIDELIAEACQEVELAAMKKRIVFQIEECNRQRTFDLKSNEGGTGKYIR